VLIGHKIVPSDCSGGGGGLMVDGHTSVFNGEKEVDEEEDASGDGDDADGQVQTFRMVVQGQSAGDDEEYRTHQINKELLNHDVNI